MHFLFNHPQDPMKWFSKKRVAYERVGEIKPEVESIEANRCTVLGESR